MSFAHSAINLWACVSDSILLAGSFIFQVEDAFADHRAKTGLTSRSERYEEEYWLFVKQMTKGEVFNSWKHFDNCKSLYHKLNVMDLWDEVSELMSERCDFLNSALKNDQAVYSMNAVLSMMTFNYESHLNDEDWDAVVIELLKFCVQHSDG
jgi:hypothetical protein